MHGVLARSIYGFKRDADPRMSHARLPKGNVSFRVETLLSLELLILAEGVETELREMEAGTISGEIKKED